MTSNGEGVGWGTSDCLLLTVLPAFRISATVPAGQHENVVLVEQLVVHDVRKAPELRATGFLVDDGRDFGVPLDLRNASFKAL